MKLILTLGLSVLLLGSMACKKENQRDEDIVTSPQVTPGAEPERSDMHRDEAETATKTEREQYIAELERRLEAMDSKIDALERDVAAESAEIEREALEEIRQEREQLSTKLQSAREAPENTWDQAKEDLARGTRALEEKYNQLLEKMQTDSTE